MFSGLKKKQKTSCHMVLLCHIISPNIFYVRETATSLIILRAIVLPGNSILYKPASTSLITADMALLSECVFSDSYVRAWDTLLPASVNKGCYWELRNCCHLKHDLLLPALLQSLICDLFQVDQLLSSVNTICMFQMDWKRDRKREKDNEVYHERKYLNTLSH